MLPIATRCAIVVQKYHRTSEPNVQTPHRPLTRGYTIAVVGIAIWSTTAILIGYLSEQYHLPPLVLAFWRDLFAAIALALGLLAFRRSLLVPPGLRRHLLFLALY